MNTKAQSKGLAVPLICLVVICLWIATPIILYEAFPSGEERGTFGDLYGSINALFSGLAFIGVIWAILLQKEELAIQRKDLEQNTAELRNQSIALSGQLSVMRATAQLQALPVLIQQTAKLLSIISLAREESDIIAATVEELEEQIADNKRLCASFEEAIQAQGKDVYFGGTQYSGMSARRELDGIIFRRTVLERLTSYKKDLLSVYDEIRRR